MGRRRQVPTVAKANEIRHRLGERQVLEAILSEVQKRRANDPLRAFTPHAAQKRFIDAVLTGSKTENFLVAANRSGKSDAGAFAGATIARFGYPEGSAWSAGWVGAKGSQVEVRDRATSGWVSALDYPTSRDTIQPKYFDNGFVPPGATHAPFIPSHEVAEWRPADQVLRLTNGSIIGFKSADSGRRKYQGAEKEWVHLDEEHPEDVYNEIIIRVGQNPLNVFTTATLLPPDGVIGGISWLFPRVIGPWKAGKLDHIGIWTMSIYDNPFIPAKEIERLESRFPPESVQGRIRLGGELIAGMSGARVYSSFDITQNVGKVPELSPFAPLVWCWDFNVEPMVTVVGQFVRPNYYIHRVLWLDEGNIGEMCDLFRKEFPFHRSEVRVYGDASGNIRTAQTKRTSYAMVQNFMSGYPAPLRLYVPTANPAIDSRIQAVNRACYDENRRRLLIVSGEGCEELVDDLNSVVSDGRGGIRKTTNRKDPYHKRTHVSDALGYWLAYEAPVSVMPVGGWGKAATRVARPGYGWSG